MRFLNTKVKVLLVLIAFQEANYNQPRIITVLIYPYVSSSSSSLSSSRATRIPSDVRTRLLWKRRKCHRGLPGATLRLGDFVFLKGGVTRLEHLHLGHAG